LTITNANLRMLVRFAYNIDDAQIVGGPPWMNSDRYDIVAKGEGNATTDQLREMLQTLLADRFDLKVHRETKELPVYALLVGKNGSKMQLSTDASAAGSPPPANGPATFTRGAPGGGPVGRGGLIVVQGGNTQLNGSMTMPQLANALSTFLGRRVLDKTGLEGNYDVKLQWTPQPGEGPALPGLPPGPAAGAGPAGGGPPPAEPGAGVFTAIQEQLGLRIDSQKGPVDTVVIDSAAKPKTDQ
jgi:uncharacterized protein (TIGR03435 family)